MSYIRRIQNLEGLLMFSPKSLYNFYVLILANRKQIGAKLFRSVYFLMNKQQKTRYQRNTMYPILYINGYKCIEIISVFVGTKHQITVKHLSYQVACSCWKL